MNTASLASPLADQKLNSSAVSTFSVPFYLYITVLSSLSIIVGLTWDISWHQTIGRDGLFSPPHLAIYFGGIAAGLFSGYRVLKVTLAGSLPDRLKSVRFWGVFHGSLGNLLCIWGAIAMLTSAPFDDWWHNTYGLDVVILSPPHTILLLGMMMIQLGAIVSVISYQNNSHHIFSSSAIKKFDWLFSLSGGFLLAMLYAIASQQFFRRQGMHGALFYQVASFLFPLFLIPFSTASKSHWGATKTALAYSVFTMIMCWLLPLFPGEPKLGPVLTPLHHFQPCDFPLLLIVPALGIDWITHRFQIPNKWLKAVVYGSVFLLVFVLVQWPFANVLMASKGHWFFGTSKWYFGADPNYPYRFDFEPWRITTGINLLKGFAIALAISILSSRIGLSWSVWMNRIVR